jgi:hypothetical protein
LDDDAVEYGTGDLVVEAVVAGLLGNSKYVVEHRGGRLLLEGAFCRSYPADACCIAEGENVAHIVPEYASRGFKGAGVCAWHDNAKIFECEIFEAPELAVGAG